jgi:hypothetical protein
MRFAFPPYGLLGKRYISRKDVKAQISSFGAWEPILAGNWSGCPEHFLHHQSHEAQDRVQLPEAIQI